MCFKFEKSKVKMALLDSKLDIVKTINQLERDFKEFQHKLYDHT